MERRSAIGSGLEVRGSRVGGVAMRYGDRASLGRGVSEVFAPASLRPDADMLVNIRHDPGKVVSTAPAVQFLPDRVEVEFDAPPAVLDEVRNGGLRHFSIEFRAQAEHFDTASFTRTVKDAVLAGVALVDRPAYRGTSVEVRQDDLAAFIAGGFAEHGLEGEVWAAGKVAAEVVQECKCLGQECTKVMFQPGAWQQSVEDATSGARDIAAQAGSLGAQDIIASTAAGTMSLRTAPNGALLAALGGASKRTPAATALRESAPAAPPLVRPIIDQELSDWVEEDMGGELVRIYSRVHLRSLLIKWADTEGWDPLHIEDLAEAAVTGAILGGLEALL